MDFEGTLTTQRNIKNKEEKIEKEDTKNSVAMAACAAADFNRSGTSLGGDTRLGL